MTDSKPVTTAVFPVAGLGTRFLPATKSVAKELLPVVDKPLIQYAVEEALECGIKTMVFVISEDKESILRHFEPDLELENRLEAGQKSELLESVRAILPPGMQCKVAIQHQPLGLGHAVLCARPFVPENEYFAVILPDDMLLSRKAGALQQLIWVQQATQSSVLGVEEIDPSLTGSYGIVEVTPRSNGALQLQSIVEKPAPEDAPSSLGVVGRYVLDASIFDLLEDLGTGAGGEIQLTDGIARLMKHHEVYACPLEGIRYDCGSRLGMVKANIDYALEIDELRLELLAHLKSVCQREA